MLQPATIALENPKPRDARRIARIEAASWRQAYEGLLPSTVLRELGTEERVFRWMNRIRFTHRTRVGVVRHQGLIVGYVTFGAARFRDLEPGFAGEVFELYVDPERHRTGAGRALLQGASHHLRQSGHHWLVLEVLRDNAPARAFYEAMGLQTEGRARNRAAGVSRRTRGLRYSLPGQRVAVVRYEGSLVDPSW